MKVVLINPYELGRQPFALAQPAAWCQSALNIDPLSACNVDPFGDARRRSYR